MRSQDEKHLLQHEDIFTSWKRYVALTNFLSLQHETVKAALAATYVFLPISRYLVRRDMRV